MKNNDRKWEEREGDSKIMKKREKKGKRRKIGIEREEGEKRKNEKWDKERNLKRERKGRREEGQRRDEKSKQRGEKRWKIVREKGLVCNFIQKVMSAHVFLSLGGRDIFRVDP